MLRQVSIGRQGAAESVDLEKYRILVGDDLIDEIVGQATELKGLRVCHLNATATGGGVAELLARQVPLLRSLGIDAEWRLIHGTTEFFRITKAVHNALQGATPKLNEEDQSTYDSVCEEAANVLESEHDVIVVHDPQPVAIRHFAGPRDAKWIWRCHIDSSAPNPEIARRLIPYVEEYDAVVLTMSEFLLPGLRMKRVAFIPPAIDPFSTKNLDVPLHLCKQVIADHGVDVTRPLIVQVSRFDPWKDPLGVISTYRLVKNEIPGVQLALIGSMAGDDPEGWGLLDLVEEEVKGDPDMFVLTNLGGVGSMEVNLFQRGCDVVIQKSLREGFGLVVSEAFWKEKPVVAGRAGGIPMQFPEGFERYLTTTVEQCAEQTIHLLRHPGERGDLGRAGRERVRVNFLLPRLIRDELSLIRELVQGRPARGNAPSTKGGRRSGQSRRKVSPKAESSGK